MSSTARVRLRAGPLLLCSGVGLYRAFWLSSRLSGLQAAEIGYLLLADLPILALLTLLACVDAIAARGWRAIALSLTGILVVLHLADAATVRALNARLQLADVGRFAVEWWLLPSYINGWSIAGLLIVGGSFLVTVPVARARLRFVCIAALGSLVLPLAIPRQAIPSHLQKYAGSVLLLGKEAWGSRRGPISRYTSGDFAAYRSEYDALFDAPVVRSGTSVIILIVESLSAADSHRTSGLGDLLPRFDELSRRGVLFRNFLANFEASEGGIVSLLSGVPPLHFPTASTNTFGEYALQRSVVDTFRRSGYRTEFITTVPMQFISMDQYARSPFVGFTFAGGQKEISRFARSPKYAFESPADHVLYEEMLHRLDSEGSSSAPVLMAAISASSHPPYVDPRGGERSEQNVWRYVQDELWWFYDELNRRHFFDHGVLIITGDHRKMLPVAENERERYGESAKARIPLAIIGRGFPPGVVDERLFQQSDLLRMLDRAGSPEGALSPFALWVERYVFVYGVASNASNLQVFEAADGMRHGYRLNLRGAEVEWIDRPAEALAIERAIHRQRALQQAARMVRVGESVLAYGRDLAPGSEHGVLVGLSSDTNSGRDPDDPQGGLRTVTAGGFDPEALKQLSVDSSSAFTMTVRAFLPVPEAGEYWFSVFSDDETCLAIDKQVVLSCQPGLSEGGVLLQPGLVRFDFRYVRTRGVQPPRLRWLPPGEKHFTDFPQHTLVLPEGR